MATDRLSREEKRNQTRADLLAAATRAFAENGFADTSLDRVAEEAGYTKGAIYSNFRNKEELILEVWDARFDETRADSDAFGELVMRGEYEQAREMLRTRAEDEHAIAMRRLMLEVWVHAMRNPQFRERFAAQMKSQLDRSTETIREAYEENNMEPPPRFNDLSNIALATEIGLAMLTVIDPETPSGLYVDLLAALMNENPFAPEST